MSDWHPVIKANKLEAVKAANPLEPSEAWLKSRSKSIGSSDIAGAVIGGSQYSNPAKVWEAKRSGIAKPPNNAMLVGSWLQPHIEEMALAWLRQFYPQAERFPGAEETFEAMNMAGMTCTPDLLVATNTNPMDDPGGIPRGVIVEIKFTQNSSNYIRKVETEKGIRDIFWPPDHVLKQVQHQLAILDNIYGCTDYDDEEAWENRELDGGFDWAGAVAVFPLGYTPAALMGPGQHIMMSPAPMRASREMLGEMEAAGSAMLGCLRDGVAPWNRQSLDLPDYYRGDWMDTPEIAEKLVKKNAVSVANVETINMINEMKATEAEIKPSQMEIDGAKDAVKKLLKAESSDKLLTEDGEVLALYSAADVLDWPAFCADVGISEHSDMLESVICHPQAAAKHTNPSDKTRRLSIRR